MLAATSSGAVVNGVAIKDGAVYVWNVLSATKLAPRFNQPLRLSGWRDAEVYKVVFSPDNQSLGMAVSADKANSPLNSVTLWSMSDGRHLQTLGSYRDPPPPSSHKAGVYGVAFSPDGSRLASAEAGTPGKVRIYNPNTGDFLAILGGTSTHANGTFSVEFSPDGSTIATCSVDNTVKLWSAASYTLLDTLYGHSADVNGIAFSPDSQMLASAAGPRSKRDADDSDDNTVKLWDLGNGSVRTLEGHTGRVWSVAFSPDPDGEILASGSNDGTVKIWRTSDGALLTTLNPNLDESSGDRKRLAWGVAFSPKFSPGEYTLATGSDDNIVKVWSLRR